MSYWSHKHDEQRFFTDLLVGFHCFFLLGRSISCKVGQANIPNNVKLKHKPVNNLRLVNNNSNKSNIFDSEIDKLKLHSCIVWNVHNTVFGSKCSAICAQAELHLTRPSVT